jgi:hypothetical protein
MRSIWRSKPIYGFLLDLRNAHWMDLDWVSVPIHVDGRWINLRLGTLPLMDDNWTCKLLSQRMRRPFILWNFSIKRAEIT